MNSDEPDERDDLWKLLGTAKPATASPFFARNVLRKIRAGEPQKQTRLIRYFSQWSDWSQWARHWKIAAACCGGLVILMGVDLTLISPRSKERAEMSQLAATNPDFEVIAHLDDLLASEESSLWTDSFPD